MPTEFCYCPAPLSLHAHGRIRYLLAASFCTLPLYFALKGKHGYTLANEDVFVAAVREAITPALAGYDLVVYPESRYPFLRQITAGLAQARELKKRAKGAVCALALANHKWSKAERLSQERAWAEMDDDFRINKVKSNQRWRYAPYLFEPVPVPSHQRVLLLDDFIMSGNTLAAMAASLGFAQYEALGVFFQREGGAWRDSVLE